MSLRELTEVDTPNRGTGSMPRKGKLPAAKVVLRWLTEQSTIIWIVALLALPASRLASPHFPSFGLVENVLVLGLFLMVVSFGQGLVILTGGLDLSVAATVTMGAFFTGRFTSAGMPVLTAVMLALLGAGFVGLINGLIVAYTPFPAFIVTLATASIATSLLLGISAGGPSQSSPVVLTQLFNGSSVWLGVPASAWLFAAALMIGLTVQSGTIFGRHAYAVGNSIRAARISGLNVRRNIVLVYVVAGISYGLAGVMLLGYGAGADLNVGNSWLLPSIAAVVVGGSSIKGGAGSYAGTVGAVVLLTILSIGIGATGISEGFKQVVYGAVILFALLGARLGGAKH